MYTYIYSIIIIIYILVGGLEHFFIFHVWDNPFHWLIFFTMVKTTNQYIYIPHIFYPRKSSLRDTKACHQSTTMLSPAIEKYASLVARGGGPTRFMAGISTSIWIHMAGTWHCLALQTLQTWFLQVTLCLLFYRCIWYLRLQITSCFLNHGKCIVGTWLFLV